MKNFKLFILCCLLVLSASAQEELEGEASSPVLQLSNNALYCKVVDQKLNKGIQSASVQLFGGKTKDSLIAAMFTRINRDFRFNNFTTRDSVKLLISAIGYAKKESIISLAGVNNVNRTGVTQKDIGNIFLTQEAQTLI
jgi:hypothetical protein